MANIGGVAERLKAGVFGRRTGNRIEASNPFPLRQISKSACNENLGSGSPTKSPHLVSVAIQAMVMQAIARVHLPAYFDGVRVAEALLILDIVY